jgi:predicted PurR-regulated permease PerM
MRDKKVLDLSWETMFKIALAVIFFYILFQIKDIVVWFVFALVISILFNPAIDFLRKFKISRSMATSIVYLLTFTLLSAVLYSVVVLLIGEMEVLSHRLSYYFQELSPFFRDIGVYAFEDLDNFVNEISSSLRELSSAFFAISFSFFGGIFTTFFVLTMAFFLSLEGKIVERAMVLIFPRKYENYAFLLWKKCQKKVSSWFFTRILACLFVGIITFIACLIAGIKYPLSLGLIAGAMNFIPYIGALVSGVLIFSIAAIDSFAGGVFVIIVFVIAQLIEGMIITPLLSQKFIGLSPVLVIMALAVGGALWGFLGALLAIPLAGILFEFLKEFLERRKKEEKLTEESLETE